MKTEYIPKVVTLLAGAIVCILSIVHKMDVTYSLKILLAVLVVFYIIGCIARIIIDKTIAGNAVVKQFSDKEEPEETQEEQKEKTEEEKETLE